MAGGFAEYVIFEAKKVYKFHTLTDEEATLVEPTACAIHGMDKLNASVGVEVLIIGAGPTGLVLAQLLKLNGASKVAIAANKGIKTEVAKQLNAGDVYVELDRTNPEAQWEQIKKDHPYGFDIVVEATGSEKVANQSIDYVRRGGKLLVYGVYDNAALVHWSPSKIFGDEINIIGSFAQMHCFPRAVSYLESGKISVKGMITDIFRIEEYEQALDKMNSRGAVKIAVKPDSLIHSMSSKRKWDQAGPEGSPVDSDSPAKVAKVDEGKSASSAAAAAAAIAAKIAAQFNGAAASGSLTPGSKDLHDGDFTHDIDINDVRNRYMLTKGSTQQQIHDETGGSVSTKGVWYPDRSKATEKDPPLYLHIAATTPEVLQKAIDKVNELISIDMGSLVEDKKDARRERRKWPEEKLPVGLESIRNFNVRAKVVGPQGMFVKYIQQETGTRVQIKGQGSGGPDEGQVARAKVLTEDLLEVVRNEHAKVKVVVHQQQMELHQAQAQYAAYSSAMSQGYNPPPPSGAPPPPPGDQPPPPPSDGTAPPGGSPPAASDQDAYAAYWAAYGYDVTSPQFKEWQASQMSQYAQYYAQQGQQGYGASPGG
ncbi:hypothetical protein EWM64_g3830, partial [Hericium alpestre]